MKDDDRKRTRAALFDILAPQVDTLEAAAAACGSPIEVQMFLAFLQVTGDIATAVHIEGEGTVWRAQGDGDGWHSLTIRLQQPIGKFRADFLLDVRCANGGLFEVVVECDGHDFHDRTKAQVARDKSRDRAMQGLGLPVLRFSGSEIHADAKRCALEAVQFVRRRALLADGLPPETVERIVAVRLGG